MGLLRQLRKTYTTKNVGNFTTSVGNFRPVQPLYGRVIRSSFPVAEMVNSTSTTASTNEPGTITDQIVTSTTNAEESPPAPTVEFDLESSAVGMTAGLFLSMLFAALPALFVH